ncbi:MAG: uroporphyrinogen decarboxylase family protein, partial [bacterium]|nr:uroporphyrinogen decarboxylase family protein [bacterium]
PYAKPSEVREHVTKCVATLAPGGGFVFNQLHNIQPDVPPENITAMYEAVKEWRYGGLDYDRT